MSGGRDPDDIQLTLTEDRETEEQQLLPAQSSSDTPTLPSAPADSSAPYVKMPEGLHVTVRTLTGQNIPVTLPVTGARVDDIKSALQQSQDIPPDFQRLIYRGRELQDGNALSTYSIEEGSVVHLVLRRREAVRPPAVLPPGAMPQQGEQLVPPEQWAMRGLDHDRIIIVQRLASAIKIFSFIDSIFLLLMAFSSPIYFIGWVMCIAGYFGAHTFNYRYMFVYLLYLVLSVALRIYIMSDGGTSVVLISMLGILIEIFIFRVAYKFTMFLRQLTPDERGYLMANPMRFAWG